MHALTYDADLVAVEHWQPTLEALAKKATTREVPPLVNGGPNREQRRAAAKQKQRA